MVFSDRQREARRALLVAVGLWAVAAAAWAQDRQPVPDAAAQERAQELIHDLYGEQYEAAKASKQRTDLAKKLLEQAANGKAEPAHHFVLLREAKEMAVLAADAETAMEAVNRIVATYDVDAMETRLKKEGLTVF